MTRQRIFLPNLLVMYVHLFIPSLPSRAALMKGKLPAEQGHSATNEETEENFFIYVKYLYRIVQLTSAAIHIRTALMTIEYLLQGSFGPHIAEAAWKVLPSPIIIGWDVVWIATRPSHPSQSSKYVAILYLLLATPIAPIAPVGVTAPYILQPISDG